MRLPALLTRGLTAVALVALVITAVVHFATYGPDGWAPALMGIWPALFIAVFPIAGSAIVVVSLGRVPLEVLLGELPAWLKIAGLAGTAYVAVNFLLMFRALSGDAQPPVFVTRLFTGHAMYFFGFAAVAWYQFDRIRSGRLDTNRLPRDDALERDPLPPPLSRTVVLQTMLSREECAARLMRPRTRPTFSFAGGGYGLRGEANADAFRLEAADPRIPTVYAVGRFEGTGPTFIRVFLTFKRWYLIALGTTLVFLPLVWWALSGVRFGWQGLLFLLVFGIGGNLLFGIAQMRSLEGQIRRTTEAQQVSIA